MVFNMRKAEGVREVLEKAKMTPRVLLCLVAYFLIFILPIKVPVRICLF